MATKTKMRMMARVSQKWLKACGYPLDTPPMAVLNARVFPQATYYTIDGPNGPWIVDSRRVETFTCTECTEQAPPPAADRIAEMTKSVWEALAAQGMPAEQIAEICSHIR